ncbi:hypothetical protein D3C87_808280 [compost metagenome]
MNFDLLLYIIFQIPLAFIVFKQDQLHKPGVLLKFFSFSLILLIAGALLFYDKNSSLQKLTYFGSQTSLIFLFLYKIIRNIYYPIFLREPEISKTPKHKIDIIPTLIIFTGTISLPFIIDIFLVQKLIDKT